MSIVVQPHTPVVSLRSGYIRHVKPAPSHHLRICLSVQIPQYDHRQSLFTIHVFERFIHLDAFRLDRTPHGGTKSDSG
jgi:hypothetical protein